MGESTVAAANIEGYRYGENDREEEDEAGKEAKD